MAKRKGKYADVLAGLPRQEEQDSRKREKINAEKDRLRATGKYGTPAEIAKRYRQLRDRDDLLKRIVGRADTQLRAAERLMWDVFDSAGLSGVDFAGGGDVTTRDEPYAEITRPDALLAWALTSKFRDRLALPWGTVNSDVKERVLHGLEIPPGIDVKVRRITTLTRPKD